jgi:hypothetical protein
LNGTTGQLDGLALDSNGYAYVGGAVTSPTVTGFITKYDPNGQALWSDSIANYSNYSLATYQDPVTGAISVYAGGNAEASSAARCSTG